MANKKVEALVDLLQSKPGDNLVLNGKLTGSDMRKISKALIDNEPIVEQFKTVDISNNEFKEIPVVFYRQRNLTQFNASQNQIVMLQSMCSWNSLTVLDISHNNLKEMPQLLLSSSPLKVLNVSHNQLRSFPHLPNSLEEIHAGSNKIKSLPQDFQDFTSLKVLNVQDNQFTQLFDFEGATENHFPKLTTLNVSKNKLETLPSEISIFVSLKSVSADGNLFEDKALSAASEKGDAAILQVLRDAYDEDAPIRAEKARLAAMPTGIFSGIMASIGQPGINPGVVKAGYLIFALLMILDFSLLIGMGPNIHVLIMFVLSCGVFGGLQLYLFELEEELGGYKKTIVIQNKKTD
eukprot:m.155979 g.155979  ORF g.155979 m.155979 type:complete len:350 (+) comp30964_c0_seq1:138-1187(+)